MLFLKYLGKRFLMFVLVLAGVSILSFALVELFGNDPAEIIARRGNVHATYEVIEQVRHDMGLDQPLVFRYLHWIGGLFAGDVGMSIYSFQPIMKDIAAYLPVSLALMGMSLLWVVVLSVPISLLCARYANRSADHTVRIITVIGLCFPAFWLGFLLLLAFAVKIPLFSVLPEPGIKGYILPSFALAVPIASAFIRIFRASLLKELASDYARYAKARGLSFGRILTAHVVRNALPPVVTLFCQYMGYLIAGAAVVESVFSLKGIGTYLIGCVTASDSTSVATCAVIVAAVYVAANFVGDVINRFLCPWMMKEYNV